MADAQSQGAATGALSGAASGAMAGAMFGPVGIAVGAVAGAVIGGAGGLLKGRAADKRKAALNRVLKVREREFRAINRQREAVNSLEQSSIAEAGTAYRGGIAKAIQGLQRGETVASGRAAASGGIAEAIQKLRDERGTGRNMGDDSAGFGARARAKAGKLTDALREMRLTDAGNLAANRAGRDTFDELSSTEAGIRRRLAAQRGDIAVEQGRLGLEDLQSEIKFKKAAGKASNVGSRTDAAGQLVTGLLQAGLAFASARGASGSGGNAGAAGGGAAGAAGGSAAAGAAGATGAAAGAGSRPVLHSRGGK